MVRAKLRRLVRRWHPATQEHTGFKFAIKAWTDLFDLHACSQVLETKRFSQILKPIAVDCPDHDEILVIAPHPDDDTFGAGGTLLKAIAKGSNVNVVYVTEGHSDPARAALIRAEAIAVCDAVGARAVFLGLQPRRIPLGDRAADDQLISLVRNTGPGSIFVPFLLDDHDDHRRVNELLTSISAEIEGGKIEVWAYQIYSSVIPNVVVDITAQVARKRELIRMWRSVSGERDWAHYILGINAANCRYLASKEPVYAEAFFVVPFNEYIQMCKIYFAHGPEKIYYSPTYRSVVT